MMDRQAHKQLVMTRAALERVELVSDLNRVQQSVGVPQLLRAALDAAVGTSVLRNWFGKPAVGASAGWANAALGLLRRYRMATAALGIVAPMLRKRRWVRRLLIGIGVGAVAWAAVRWRGPERAR